MLFTVLRPVSEMIYVMECAHQFLSLCAISWQLYLAEEKSKARTYDHT